MVMCHGYADTPETMTPFALKLAANFPDIGFLLVRGTLPIYGAGFSWFSLQQPDRIMAPSLLKVAQDLELHIRDIAARAHISDQQIYWLGFSQGAAVVLAVALQSEFSYRGSFVLSGDIFPSFITHSKTPFYLLQGLADTVMPPVRMQHLERQLREKRNKVMSAYLEGVGHEHRAPAVEQLKKWLHEV